MKIEKINDNQIRCTLTKEDLADRQIKISELAYGSEKAKRLFRDMIEQANYEFGFEADDIPLMIEAIPLSGENIILQITKVEYPEELDTRFSKFSEGSDEEEDNSDMGLFSAKQGADDILDLYQKIKQVQPKEIVEAAEVKPQIPEEEPEEVKIPTNLTKMFEFRSLEQVERLAVVLGDYYRGENDFYKDETKNRYYLLLRKGEHTPEEFNKVCNIISEYASQKKYSAATEAFFMEHGKLILGGNALAVFATLN
jgi:adapter protein MecA 1/2